MKKLLLLALLAFVLIIPDPCPAADRACQPIWDNVAGQTYVLEIEDQSFDVVFSGSYAGPCPIGRVELYDGIYIESRFICPYRTVGNDSIILELSDDFDLQLFLWHGKLQQIVIPPNAIVLTPAD